MKNKTLTISLVAVFGLILFAFSPFAVYADAAYAYTGNATNITQTSATLNGTASTGGLQGNAWFEYGTDVNMVNSTTLNAFIYNGGYGGSYSTNIYNLTPSTTYYFRSVAQNSYGRVYGSLASFTTNYYSSLYNNSYPYNYQYNNSYNNSSLAPTAVTTSGETLSNTTAQFDSFITTGSTGQANTWFEWGTTPDLGEQTVTVPINGSPTIKHTDTITGLSPGTTYYFRAVAQNSYGRNAGTILSLTTSGSRQIYVQPSTPTYVAPAPTPAPAQTTTPSNTSTNNNSGTSSTSALGANVLGASSFLPASLFGWLLIIILVLILLLLSKQAYNQFSKPK
jgi:hypothetical protein